MLMKCRQSLEKEVIVVCWQSVKLSLKSRSLNNIFLVLHSGRPRSVEVDVYPLLAVHARKEEELLWLELKI